MKIPTILLCLLMAGCCTKSNAPRKGPLKMKLKRTSANDVLPCDPCGTNTYEWPPFISPVYTNGELALKVVGLSSNVLTMALTNVSPYREYEIQFSPILPGTNWSTETVVEIGNHNPILFEVSVGGDSGFYRAHDVTGDDVIVYPTYGGTNSQSGSGCPGSYVGLWVYRPFNNIFPFIPAATNTFIDPTGSTDARIELLGRFGDTHCGTLPLTLTSLPDPYYALTIYFKTVMVGTNYPIILRGFTVRTN